MRRFGQRKDLELFGVARRKLSLANYLSVDLSQPFDLPFRPDVVIHAAARASPWGTAREYVTQNVEATRQVIRFCEQQGLPKLLYVSSSSVFYRNEHQFDLTEESPIGPAFVNQYAATKYAGEELARTYAGEHLILRPRAVFGPGDTVVFPRILVAARQGRLPQFIPDGQPAIGDLVYIDTLCDYLLKAATQTTPHKAYNLTNAKPVELQALVLTVLERLGIPAPRRQFKVSTAMRLATLTEWTYRLFRLAGEPPITRFGVSVFAYSKTFDTTRMLTDLGEPSVSLDEGIDRFITWQKAQSAS
jgi:2-alkyl-3-oxoalkanoate reductase